MAINSIDSKLDSMSVDMQAAPVVSQDALAQAKDTELLPSKSEPEQFEPQVVAGPFGAFRKALKAAPQKLDSPILKEGEDLKKIGAYQVVKEKTLAEAEKAVEAAPLMPTTGKPSPKSADIPETVTNIDNIVGPDELKQHIEAVGRSAGADKLTKMSYKDVAQKASDDGYDEVFIARLLDSSVATKADPREAYKMLLAVTDAGDRAFQLGEKVKAAKANGTLTSELASEFSQAVALEGVILKASRGRQADIARTLGIFSQARKASANRGEMLDAIMTEAGGIDSVFDLANKYTALDSRSARASLSDKTIGGTVKDIWLSTWINGMLSSPVSHIRNVAGNMFFSGYQIPERAVASVIGKVRNAAFGGERAIEMNEVMAQAIGFLQGMREGAVIGGKAFAKNTPTDPLMKIEASRAGRDAFDIDLGGSAFGKASSEALKYWGNFVTLPGRALMAEDEFAKAVGYRMELNALATREGNNMYANLVKNGVSDADATAQSARHVESILLNPPSEIDDASKSMSRTLTFTRELEPALQEIQKFTQNPLVKMFVPFFKTPANIAMEGMSRTPGVNLVSPRFWGDYDAGGIQRDMAMARVTLGGAMMYGIGSSAIEGSMTGYGPMRTEDKKALEGTGYQQFSMVFKKGDISVDLINKFKELTSVSEGPEKVYISYAGLEPFATLAGMSATAGEYAQMGGNGYEMDKLMMGGALGLYEYLAEQPMLQGFSDMSKVLTSGAKDAPSMFYEMSKAASKQVGSVAIGGSPIGAYSSMVGAVERIMDPRKSNTMPSEMGTANGIVDGAARGFWESLNTFKSRNPLTSDSLPRQLDTVTGEAKKVGNGNFAEMFNPFRTSDGKVSPAHQVLIDYGVPMYIPDKKIGTIELSASQYNRWIELATEGGQLERKLTLLGKSKGLERQAGFDLAGAQDTIASEMSQAYQAAKERLLVEDPELAQAIRDVKDLQRDEGKYKR
jgi:hypothetical protein